MIRFLCPKCEKVLGIDEDKAGRQGMCPACGQKFVVPNAKPRANLNPTPRVEPPTAPPRPRVTPRVSPPKPIAEDEDIPEGLPEEDELEAPAEKKRPRRMGNAEEIPEGLLEDDEPETLPKKQRRKRSRNRARGDDSDYGDTTTSKVDRRGWRITQKGLFLVVLALCLFMADYPLQVLINLSKQSETLLAIRALLLAGAEILATVGMGFCIAVPARSGARGLAIASLALGASSLMLTFFAVVLPVITGEPLQAVFWALLALAAGLGKWLLFMMFLMAMGSALGANWLSEDVGRLLIRYGAAVGLWIALYVFVLVMVAKFGRLALILLIPYALFSIVFVILMIWLLFQFILAVRNAQALIDERLYHA